MNREPQSIPPDDDFSEGEDDPAAALIGRTIAGRYRITGVIGRGGMGVVYAGTQLELDRDVAIKVLPGQFTRESDVLKRFEREARTASKINHPNVVAVFDYGRLESGEPYLVMERLSGRDLDVVLSERPTLSLPEVLDIVEPIARALDALHERGVVHRDIKPSNVFFTHETIKLVDFGLAVLRSHEERLTRSGTVVGTAEYMAPEAARGALVDARGDVYSLATMAYELISGTVPFVGPPMQVLIDKVTHSAPAIRTVAPTPVPNSVDRVIAKALERKPEHRYGSAGEFARELRKAIENKTASVAPDADPPAATGAVSGLSQQQSPTEEPSRKSADFAAPTPTGRRPPLAAALVVLLLALGAGSMMLSRGGGNASQPPAQSSASPPNGPAAVAAPPAEVEVAAEPAPLEPATAPEAEVVAQSDTPATPAPRNVRERLPRTRVSASAAAGSGNAATVPARASSPAQEGGAERANALVREAQGALLHGEMARARELYREATGAAPRNAAAWRGLGLVSERLNLTPEATQAYERYLRIAPEAADASTINERLSRLRGQ